MGSRDLSLYIGPPHMGSRIEATVEGTRLVVEETTAAGIAYLDDAETTPACIVTDHEPPERDCFELLDAVPSDVPVIVAPNGGSSSVATGGLRAGAATYLDPTTLDDGPAALAAEIDRLIAEGEQYAHQTGGGDERIERFASIVSHELRSPIQTAKSGIALVKTQCDSDYLDNVDETLDRMDELVDNLVDELKHGETTVEMEAVDLAAVVEEAWPDRTAATLSIDSELPTIEAEHARLRQLFNNLFRNSVEHGSAGSRPRTDGSIQHDGEGITVRVGTVEAPDGADRDESIGLYIADDGPGIDPDRHEEIFEYGYSGSAEGTGFGLAIVSEIVDAFGWTVDVTESDDGGARFELQNVKLS